MRILGRLIAFLITLVCLAAVALPLHSKIRDAWREGSLDVRIEGALPSVAYVVPKDKWLEFPVNAYDDLVRVISNVNVSPRFMGFPETTWEYALRYQIVDTQGKIIEDKRYHHRARLALFEDKQQRIHTSTFYLDQDQVPTSGRILLLNLTGMGNVAKIRLKVEYSDPSIGSIVARLYQRESLTQEALRSEWRRLSERQQQNLARASVYGPELLRDFETQNLLRRRWRPQGPLGVQDKDYQRRRLYVLEEPQGEPVDEYIVPSGLYVSEHVTGVIGIPAPGGRVTLEASNASDISSHGRHVFVEWFGRSGRERRSLSFPVDGDSLSVDLQKGVLQIRSYSPVVIRAYLYTGDESQEITPAPNTLRVYTVGDRLPLEFSISHVRKQPTPFRLDLRLPLIEHINPVDVTYSMLDQAGEVIESGTLTAQANSSEYDWLRDYQPPSNISEAARYYFNLDARVHRIRLTAPSPVLVAAYTRPDDLIHRTRVPSDYRIGESDDDRQPTWFVIRPVQHDQLRKSFRSFLLSVQPRPPEVDPEVVAGRYKWESYRPEGIWHGRYLLSPVEELTNVREQARSTTFRELNPGREVELNISGRPNDRRVTPTLLYIREHDIPQSISLRIDGRIVYEGAITGYRGIIKLPAVTSGVHNVSINASDDTQWMISHAGAGYQGYQLRLSQQVGDKPLHFFYEKVDIAPEVLSVQIQSNDHDQALPTKMRIKIAGERRVGGPFQSWTLTDREFEITPDPSDSVVVFGTKDELLNKTATLFVPIGDDFPLGRYRIELELMKGPASYVTLYRIIPGEYSEHQFFTENILDDV